MIINLATAFLDFAIFFYVLSANTRASKAIAFLAVSLGLWSTELFFLSYIEDIDQLRPLFHVTRWGLFFLPPACAFLAYKLAQTKSKLFFFSTILPCLLISSALCISNTFIFPSELIPADQGFIPKKDTLYFVFMSEVILSTIATATYSFFALRSSKAREKQNVAWSGMAIVFVFGSGVALSFLFIKFEHSYFTSFIGAFANLTYISFILYITNTKSLVDIKKAASMIISHTLTISLTLSIYFYLIDNSGVFSISPQYITISSIILLPLIIFHSATTQRITHIISRFIAKNSYDKDLIISNTKTKFEESKSIDELFSTLNHLFTNTINVKQVIFYRITNNPEASHINTTNVYDISANSDPCVRHATKNKKIFFSDETPTNIKSYMETLKIEVVIPIFIDGDIRSIIYAGKPTSSQLFTDTDIEFFEWVQKALPKTITRIENLKILKNELNESRKTLSMLEVMNQYHHDIKTPLAVIDGIVSTDMYDKEFQRKIVLEQVTKGTNLIATMASILRGKHNRETKKIRLNDCIKQCLFLFDNRFEEISVEFNDKSEIFGDDIDLKILFSNLLKNAVEAADPKRALTLKVKTWNDTQYAYVSLTDSGTGIPSNAIESIWNLEKSEKITGNAIGLQAVKRIAEEHEALISVTSAPGDGTCFKLRFPRAIH